MHKSMHVHTVITLILLCLVVVSLVWIIYHIPPTKCALGHTIAGVRPVYDGVSTKYVPTTLFVCDVYDYGEFNTNSSTRE